MPEILTSHRHRDPLIPAVFYYSFISADLLTLLFDLFHLFQLVSYVFQSAKLVNETRLQIETNRNTALTLACFQGRQEVVKLLLDYRANVEHRAKVCATFIRQTSTVAYT